jgi:hypothetical protein
MVITITVSMPLWGVLSPLADRYPKKVKQVGNPWEIN